jgi:hypothetical protein
MAEKFSITKSNIDLKKLLSKIDEFIVMKNESPYIFLSQNTLDDLIVIVGYSSDGLLGSENGLMCGRFKGNKVFCDNTLKYGEIELR